MKTEEQVRDRYDTLMQTLKKLNVHDAKNDRKMLTISAVLRELDWVLE